MLHDEYQFSIYWIFPSTESLHAATHTAATCLFLCLVICVPFPENLVAHHISPLKEHKKLSKDKGWKKSGKVSLKGKGIPVDVRSSLWPVGRVVCSWHVWPERMSLIVFVERERQTVNANIIACCWEMNWTLIIQHRWKHAPNRNAHWSSFSFRVDSWWMNIMRCVWVWISHSSWQNTCLWSGFVLIGPVRYDDIYQKIVLQIRLFNALFCIYYRIIIYNNDGHLSDVKGTSTWTWILSEDTRQITDYR